MRLVNQAIPKLDGLALTAGQGAYTDDLATQNGCLVVKVLRSPLPGSSQLKRTPPAR